MRGTPPSRPRLFGVLAGLALLAGTLERGLLAGDAREGTIYATVDLRIYRALDRQGRPTVVLTNLDEYGNLLRPTPDESPCAPPSSPAEAPSAKESDKQAAGRAPVQIIINQGGSGAGPDDSGAVDVRGGTDGDTTIVININNNPAPPAAPPSSAPLVYPAVLVGGLPGPFRYPDHQPFLGYSLDGSSPGLFGGLGLNAGNQFGIKTGRSCEHGYDCMFGAAHGRP